MRVMLRNNNVGQPEKDGMKRGFYRPPLSLGV
jgi:hypothetical protein